MTNLTEEQEALLAEVEKENFVFVLSRKAGATEEDRKKLHILKSLAYKNLVAFDADFNDNRFVFVSRKAYPDYP